MTPSQLKKLHREGKIAGFKELKKERKVCKYKAFIQAALESYCAENGYELLTEFQFAKPRRWRFDWAILDGRGIIGAIEYEGIFSAKSRHTSLTGFQGDIEKYNTAALLGWPVLRYTAKNFKDILTDLEKL